MPFITQSGVKIDYLDSRLLSNLVDFWHEFILYHLIAKRELFMPRIDRSGVAYPDDGFAFQCLKRANKVHVIGNVCCFMFFPVHGPQIVCPQGNNYDVGF